MYTSPCSGSTPSSPTPLSPHRTEGGGGWIDSIRHLPQSCVEGVRKG